VAGAQGAKVDGRAVDVQTQHGAVDLIGLKVKTAKSSTNSRKAMEPSSQGREAATCEVM